jgi:PE family
LANVGSTIGAANAAAAFPTTSVSAARADDVSATIAALFGAHAQAYHAPSAQAATLHSQFVQLLNAGASSYAGVFDATFSRVCGVQKVPGRGRGGTGAPAWRREGRRSFAESPKELA